jgi:hypothetical protein
VRTVVVTKLQSLLSQITTKNGYTFNVGPNRVFLRDIIGPNVEIPALFLVQRTESASMMSVQRHVRRTLAVQVGFLAAYNGPYPDEYAVQFMSDIQRAVGYEHMIDVQTIEDPTVTVQLPIAIEETGTAVNIAEPMQGRIFGQVDYSIRYHTSHLDSRYI